MTLRIRHALAGSCALLLGLGLAPGCSTGHHPTTAANRGSFSRLDANGAIPAVTPMRAKAEPTGAPRAGVTSGPEALPAESFIDPFARSESALPGAHASPERAVNPGDRPSPVSPSLSIYGGLRSSGLPTSPAGQPFDGSENISQVSYAREGADFDPCVSHDGTMVAFASTQHRATADIYTKTVTGRTVTQLTTDPANDVMPAFSPDGQRIAFASDRDGSWDIYIMSLAGGQAVQLTGEGTPELHPTWSSDGRHIAYCRLGETSGRWELWVAEVESPGVRKFVGYGLFPSWSPTGDKILFQRSRDRGAHFFSVWTIDFVEGEGVNLTEIASSPTAAIVNPSWSPDGRRIAFATIPNPTNEYGQRPANADIWICDLEGGARTNLTNGLFVNLMPTWGPDRRVYFVSDRGGHDNIWALDPQRAIVAAGGEPPTDLANVPTESEPAKSPH